MSPKLLLIVTFTGPSATGVAGGFWTFFAGCWPLSRYWHAPLSAEGDALVVVSLEALASGVPLSPQPVATSARQASRTARYFVRAVTGWKPRRWCPTGPLAVPVRRACTGRWHGHAGDRRRRLRTPRRRPG